MSFLDSLKDKFRMEPQDDGYYDDGFDDGLDDGYYDEAVVDDYADQREGRTGLLGNTPRPEADSVSVYTRSGRPLGGNGGAPKQGYDPAFEAGRIESQQTRTAPVSTAYVPATTPGQGYAQPAPAQPSTERKLTAVPRSSSSQLPPYVLKPQSYNDVQMVVRRVRTNQPVVLSFQHTNIDTAKRIFDFCAGLACGVGGAIEELGDRCFVVLPEGRELSQGDVEKLVADGTITR